MLTIATAAGICTGIYVVSMNDEIGGGDEVSEDDVVTASGAARGRLHKLRTHRIGAGARGRAPQRASWGHDVRADHRDGRKCTEGGLDIESRAAAAGERTDAWFPPEKVGSDPKRPLRLRAAYGAS